MDAPDRLQWIKDDDPRWDADRRRVFATVPDGVFSTAQRADGEPLTSDWWRVVEEDRVVGYGWLDDVWGDAEILLAVEESARGSGVGAFALAHLEAEAAARGLNYVVNVVRDTHPQRDQVSGWFRAHGFTGTEDGRLRKQVGDRARDIGQHQAGRPGSGRARPPDEAGATPRPGGQGGGGARPPDEAARARYTAERDRAAARPRTDAPEPAGAPLGP